MLLSIFVGRFGLIDSNLKKLEDYSLASLDALFCKRKIKTILFKFILNIFQYILGKVVRTKSNLCKEKLVVDYSDYKRIVIKLCVGSYMKNFRFRAITVSF